MTILLDGLTLNPDLVWEERYSSQAVTQSMRRTLGGVPVVFSGLLTKGESITLAAREVNGSLIGVLKKSLVDALLARAAVPGAVYTLTVDGVDYPVVFRHQDAPAVNMVPLIARTAYGPTDLMRGEIRLMTV